MKPRESRGVLRGHEVMPRAEELAGLEVEATQIEAEVDHTEGVNLVLLIPHKSRGIAHTITIWVILFLPVEEAVDESMALNAQLEDLIGRIDPDTSSPEVHIS